MLITLDSSIISGHLSNEVPGLVTGSLVVAGQKEPLSIELHGNFMRDIAGCRVDLFNPMPEANTEHSAALSSIQNGAVGIMTASYRVPFAPKRKQLKGTPFAEPPGLKNLLFLEWFSQQNQRILIQSWHYQLTVSAPLWQLSQKEETRQMKMVRGRRKQFLLGHTTAAANPPSATKQAMSWEKQSRPQMDGSASPLVLVDQASEGLAIELRKFQQLLAVTEELKQRPAVLRLLSSAGDLAAHLADTLRNFRQLKSTEWAQLIADIEQSHPLFHAALTACDKMLDQSTPGTDQRWLMAMQHSLAAITGQLEQLVKWLRAK